MFNVRIRLSHVSTGLKVEAQLGKKYDQTNGQTQQGGAPEILRIKWMDTFKIGCAREYGTIGHACAQIWLNIMLFTFRFLNYVQKSSH